MKYLSKVDFSKFKLPEIPRCPGCRLRVIHKENKLMIGVGDVDVFSCYLTRWTAETNTEWFAGNGMVCLATDAVRTVLDAARQVDAFIEAELKRMAEESLPPWRECTLEEAMANPGCSEAQWIYTPGVDVYGEWRPFAERDKKAPFAHQRYRTRAPKAEANMPSVKAPEGWRWERSKYPKANPGWHLRSDHCGGEGLFRHVPCDRSERDALLACVAVFDEANGPAPGPLAIGWAGKTWLLVEVAK